MSVIIEKKHTLCINCMQEKNHAAICTQCGYDARRYKAHPLFLEPGTLLKNQYLLGRVLGQGGFGITYIGLDIFLQKKVAIKEYLPAALATRDIISGQIIPVKKQEESFARSLQLFLDEARHLAKFNHPNIVRVSNYFEDHQTGYMVMDYLEGQSVANMLLQQKNGLPVEQALAILLPILEALEVIHAQRIYHRDISPQNIILTEGKPILIDFGAARHVIGEHSRTLDLVLKHGYSPLEQYSGKGKIGAWTDIYACGALLYQLLTGILPPAATDRFCEDTLKPLSAIAGLTISPTLHQAVMGALAIKTEHRFQTISVFKATLLGEAVPYLPQNRFAAPKRTNQHSLPTIELVALLLLTTIPLNFADRHRLDTVQPLDELFSQVQTQWMAGKMLSPANDNVLASYQQILALHPNDKRALIGMRQLAEHYHRLAKTAYEQQNWNDSLGFIKQGLQVIPDYVELKNLLTLVTAQITHQEEKEKQQKRIQSLLEQASQQLAVEQVDKAYQTYQSILAISSDNAAAQEGLKQVSERYVKLAHEIEDVNKRLAFINDALSYFPDEPNLLYLRHHLLKEQDAKIAQQRYVETTLKKAEQLFSQQRLLEPVGDNAYETYQELLKVMPNNLSAQTGIRRIAEYFLGKARAETELAKKLVWINKGLKVLPSQSELLALHEETTRKLSTLAKKALPRPITTQVKPVTPSVSSIPPVLAPPLKPVTTPPPPAPPPVTVKNPVGDLLVIAKNHLNNGQLESAYQTYRSVFTLDTTNVQAQIGMKEIADSYEKLAAQQKNQGYLSESLILIDKGLMAYPMHNGLLRLQSDVTQQLEEKSKPTVKESPPPSNILFTPSF